MLVLKHVYTCIESVDKIPDTLIDKTTLCQQKSLSS